jgi:hypothetical protein
MGRTIKSIKQPKKHMDDPARNGNPKWRSNYTTGGWCKRRATCRNFERACGGCYLERLYEV